MPSLTTQNEFISYVHHNAIQSLVAEVIGVGDDGYGLNSYFSNPVTDRNIATAQQWRRLLADLNSAYTHITNTATLTGTIITGTTIISSTLTNAFWDAANFVVDNRYTCHPNQYFRDPVTNEVLNSTDGTSTRVTSWGTGSNIAITHRVNVTWASRLTARYFFNLGGVFEWKPYHLNTSTTGLSLNDLDSEWASFINHVQGLGGFVYDRNTFIDYAATSTVYTSGTLKISVLADKETERNVRFTFTFTNVDTPDLVVIPTTEYYNILV